jgi:outer membrane protein OmpA-like peptidoglycan-associated protein
VSDEREQIGEAAPMWVVSFADLICLMMGFFVILAAANAGGGGKYPDSTEGNDVNEAPSLPVELVGYIREAFGYEPTDPGDPVDQFIWAARRSRAGSDENRRPKTSTKGHEDFAKSIRPDASFAIQGAAVYFDEGSDKLTADADKPIATVAEIIRGHNSVYLVKGHVSAGERDDADLDYRRAQAVYHRLLDLGVSPKILRVQACGPYEPAVAPAYSPEAEAKNRRVEVVSAGRAASLEPGERREALPASMTAPFDKPTEDRLPAARNERAQTNDSQM